MNTDRSVSYPRESVLTLSRALLLNRNPNAIAASIEERRFEQPRTLSVIAKAFSAQVEVPFSARQPELIAGGRGVGRSRIDRWLRIR